MGNIHPQISPRGMGQKDMVDALYMVVSSIAGICTKLDADAGVPLTTYLANCYTNIFTVKIEDQKGNITGNTGYQTNDLEASINPYGVSDKALIELMYQIHNALETLTEQLDADALTDSTYEALCYTAIILHQVTNSRGNTLGNGTAYYFRPGGVLNQKEFVDWLYSLFNCIETLTEQLDADGTVTDTNYEALWYTATCTLMIEDSKGNVLGVSR